eukprot:762863-Hanusia_phi.AAC.4
MPMMTRRPKPQWGTSGTQHRVLVLVLRNHRVRGYPGQRAAAACTAASLIPPARARAAADSTDWCPRITRTGGGTVRRCHDGDRTVVPRWSSRPDRTRGRGPAGPPRPPG